MNTPTSIPSRRFFISRVQTMPCLLGLLLAASNLVHAQTTAAPASLTREQVKMERDEFLKTHRYELDKDVWILKPGFEPPAGVKTRDQVKAERDEFLRNNRYDEVSSTWVPLKGAVTPVSTKSREQVRAETRQFMRTHRWDETKQMWEEYRLPAKKAKP